MTVSIAEMLDGLDGCMLSDRHRLRRQLRELSEGPQEASASSRNRRRPRKPPALEQVQQRWAQSVETAQRRLQQCPQVTFPSDLPIMAHHQAIVETLRDHQVLVLCGETGSGKSTQLPKICLDAGRGVHGMIGHTQPRRLAARSVATRLAQELRCPLGEHVGYKIRFLDETNPGTYIKLMTDGVLLAETQHDRFLERYDTIILDEAHERSLNVDFLLGYLHRLLPKRPELRLIITSATIDVERFCNHFRRQGKPAPLIEVSGRTYPVEVRYRPAESDDSNEPRDFEQTLAAGVEEACADGPGDVLVFLPTEREIRDAARLLRGWLQTHREAGGVELLPLYARLSNAEQQRIFQPHKGRRIVLATNVAESSLTVPGIRYVVDAGTARISRYAPRSKVQRLPIEAISQASADQRKGRCGRVGPGVCIRLYSEDDFLSRDRFTTPEIRRTNLAAVVLQTESLRLGAVDEFPFLDPPRPEAIREAYKTLFELGAVDGARRLTKLGKRLCRMPVDPRIGRMILEGAEQNCLSEMLIIASALEIPDPRQRPVEKQQAADEAHAQHADPQSDFMALLNLWDFYHELKEKLSRNQLKKALQQNFLSPARMQEWMDIHRQLRRLAIEAKMKPNKRENDYEAIHRALLTGLLSNLAKRGEKHDYEGPGGGFQLWPGSGVFKAKPAWVMAAELVETSRRYLRTVAKIQSAWIEPAAGHLVKRSHSDPHWSDKSGNAMAHEKVTLFGITISSGRRVPLGPIDPPLARQLMIEHGLVESRLRNKPAFLIHNEAVVDRIKQRAARTRDHALIVDERRLLELYEARIPEDVCDPARLRRWLKQLPRGQRPLHFHEAELAPQDDAEALQAFPERLSLGSLDLPAHYRFEPGEEDDGISITVPSAALNQVREEKLGWLVPGLLEEKVLALIRSLPKQLRRNFVPAPDTAQQVVEELEFGKGDFLGELARALTRRSDEPVRPEHFAVDDVDAHLRMHVRVVDDDGEVMAQGRELQQLRAALGAADPEARARTIDDPQWNQDGLTSWSFGDLPGSVEVTRGGVQLPVFPAIVDQGDAVGLRLLDTQASADRETQDGVRRLFVLAERKELRSQIQWLPGLEQASVYGAGLPDVGRLRDELQVLLGGMAFFQLGKLKAPRTEEQYLKQCKEGALWAAPAAQELAGFVRPLLENYHQVRLQVEELGGQKFIDTVEDIRFQCDMMLAEGFLAKTPWNWLQHVPRYLQAAAARLEKVRSNLHRDAQNQAVLDPHWQRWLALPPERQIEPAFEDYRWMVEEFRVSLFAQELGTSCSVSAKRLDKQWEKAEEG